MGASAVWHALRRRPATFAAGVAISAVPPDSALVPGTPRVPPVLMHGTADTENPYAGPRAAYGALRRAGRGHVEVRGYPALGHAIAPEALTGIWRREWMFRRRR